MSYDLPSDKYPAFEEVPEEGASCSTCKFLGKDGRTCRNKRYIKEHGDNTLDEPADRWCSIWWTPKGGR